MAVILEEGTCRHNQIGLWVCICSIFLLANLCMAVYPTLDSAIPKQVGLRSIKMLQDSKQYSFVVSALGPALNFIWIPSMQNITYKPNKPFLLQVALVRTFYHSNRK